MTINGKTRLRYRALANSATVAFSAASIPPIPTPVSKRHSDNCVTSLDVGARSIPVAITTRQPMIVHRRPKRSAMPPNRIEPAAMPISSIDKTQPSTSLGTAHSSAIPGAAKLIDITSKPSSALSRIVIAKAAICHFPKRPSSIISLGVLAIKFLCALLTRVDDPANRLPHWLGGARAPSEPGLYGQAAGFLPRL